MLLSTGIWLNMLFKLGFPETDQVYILTADYSGFWCVSCPQSDTPTYISPSPHGILSLPTMTYRKHYIPLESDPEIFTCLMHKIGVNASLKFVDVWSLEQDEIQSLPGPVQALILIMPACPAYEEQ